MKQYLPEPEFARPAPFPKYPEDRRRLWLERSMRMLGGLLLVAILAPGVSRPDSPLTIPVFYDRIELPERSPVALRLDLPHADYSVSPAGLGFFDEDGRFIYTADTSRGLIYGRNRQGVIAIELSSPRSEPVYMEERLDSIRASVSDINDIKNRLRLRRLSFQEGRNDFEESVDAAWNEASGQDGLPDLDALDGVMHKRFAGRELEAARVLSDRARNLAELKQLYYESQFARLKLLLEQFDLQLGLARLPRQQFEELLSLGDENLVRETMLGEIERMQVAWDVRRGQLQASMASDLGIVNGLEQPVARGVQGLLPPLPVENALASAGSSDDGIDDMLRISLAQTRTQIANAELQLIGRGMEKLTDATKHVQAGQLPGWTKLREIQVRPVRLELPGIEELDLFARVGERSVDPERARDLLLELNRSFEEDLSEELHESGPDWGEPREQQELSTNELAYGLIAVDSSTHSLGSAPQRAEGGVQLPQLLEDILEQPEGFEVSQYELGYLRFMKWYAELDPNDSYAPLGE